jgi:hypothetical protein
MVFETIYLLREVAKAVAQNEIRVPVKSLRDVIFDKLLGEDSIAIYPSEKEFYEDLKTLQKLSFLTIAEDIIVINRDEFLNATKFIERQEQLLRDDRYAVAMFKRLKQRAQHIILELPAHP